jgi:antitoxin ParD1/3/4
MSTIIISMPKTLRSFVAEQVADHGYENSGEYIRELIRRDHERQKLRRLLIEGGSSPAVLAGHSDGFDYMRMRARLGHGGE